MKKLLFFMICALPIYVYSQSSDTDSFEKTNIATVGILQGGGSLIGMDMEFRVTNKFGLQLGAGLVGFGAGLNYHLSPGLRSSFISLQYWNQGVGDSFTQNVLGPSYVFRGKKWFTFQLGLGATLSEGPALPNNYNQPPVMLLYAIGVYFPV